MTDHEVRLRPDRLVAGGWSLLAIVLLGAGAWFVVDSRGHVVAWLAVGLFVAVGAYFLLQLLAPGWFEVVLDDDVLRSRVLWFETTVPWDQVHLARVESAAGEPFLELHVREPAPTGDPWRTRALGVLLPLGVDLDALHRFLARRLGPPGGGLPRPGTLTPLDL